MQINGKDYSEWVKNVIDGDADPLICYAELKAAEAFIASAIKEVKAAAVDEAEKHGKDFAYHGFNFSRTEGRRIWSYKHISEWAKTSEHLKAIEKTAKTAAEQLEKGVQMVDENGEVVEPAHYKFTDPTLSVK